MMVMSVMPSLTRLLRGMANACPRAPARSGVHIPAGRRRRKRAEPEWWMAAGRRLRAGPARRKPRREASVAPVDAGVQGGYPCLVSLYGAGGRPLMTGRNERFHGQRADVQADLS